ncbi:hypothetical protein D6833_03655, partial [Candidatus Parcubacteria bacterium]
MKRIGNEIEQLFRRMAERAAKEEAEAKKSKADDEAEQNEAQPRGKVLQLRPCYDPMREIPSDYIRSALFGVVRKGRRRYLEREPIAAWQNVSIEYTGQRLDQYDLDVL